MHPSLFLALPFAIQLHVFCAVGSLVLGTVVLFRRKGTANHRLMGKMWVLLMGSTALSSFFIHSIRWWGPFSPIHILSAGTLVGLFVAVQAARRRQIVLHQAIMKNLYVFGLIVPGIFTMFPGRFMQKMIFGPLDPGKLEMLTIAIVVAATVVAAAYLRSAGHLRLPPLRRPARQG